MKRLIALAALLVVTSGLAYAHETSTNPDIILEDGGMVYHTIGRTQDVLLIDTTSSALDQALNDLGVPYDLFFGDNFAAVDLSPYSHVFVAMDGGLVEAPSVQNAANFASNGGCLHFYGGTCYQPYAIALDQYLLTNQTNNYCWTTVFGAPHSTVVDGGHYLAAGLPANYNFADISASYYQTRNTDAGAAVAAVNGDGFDHLLSKGIGTGNFDYCINSPYEFYYANPSDYQWLLQVVENMLVCAGPTATEQTSWGSVKSLYR
jgi:hypothetical protein